jgi:hypothetical protein
MAVLIITAMIINVAMIIQYGRVREDETTADRLSGLVLIGS